MRRPRLLLLLSCKTVQLIINKVYMTSCLEYKKIIYIGFLFHYFPMIVLPQFLGYFKHCCKGSVLNVAKSRVN